MESLDGVDRLMMSGTRGTLVLASGATLDEADVKRVVEKNGLKFEGMETVRVERAPAAYVAKTPKFT